MSPESINAVLLGIVFMFVSCSDIRVFCKNNEYSCSFFFPEHEYVLPTRLRSTYVDTIFVSYSLSSHLIEKNIRIRKKKTNTK